MTTFTGSVDSCIAQAMALLAHNVPDVYDLRALEDSDSPFARDHDGGDGTVYVRGFVERWGLEMETGCFLHPTGDGRGFTTIDL